MLLKKRKAKHSLRGLYIEDKELQETVFQPGENYKYFVDVKKKKLIITPSSSSSDNIVAKRKRKDSLTSVIDIRRKAALEAFQGSDFLEIEIYGDQIIVTGFSEKKENSVVSTALSLVDKVASKFSSNRKNVVDIKSKLKTKQDFRIRFSTKGLKQAVGHSFEQLTFDFDAFDTLSKGEVVNIQDKLKNVGIPLQVASLFSGAGLLDSGFVKEGFDILFASDIDPNAAETYKHNLGNHIEVGDILDLNDDEIPQAPIMIAGSPCKPFSNANRQQARLSNHKDSVLVAEFIRRVKLNGNCKVFVLENVPGFLGAEQGKYKDMILSELGKEFDITYGKISAASVKTPQLRDRVVFIGSKIGKIDLPSPLCTSDNYLTVGDAFKGLTDDIPNQLDQVNSSQKNRELMSYVSPGGCIQTIPQDIKELYGKKSTHSNFMRRLELDKPSCTIVDFSKAMLIHPFLNRVISMREAARLQGVEDDFVFKGIKSSMVPQIANGVPVPLARSLAKVIREAIERFNIRQNFSY